MVSVEHKFRAALNPSGIDLRSTNAQLRECPSQAHGVVKSERPCAVRGWAKKHTACQRQGTTISFMCCAGVSFIIFHLLGSYLPPGGADEVSSFLPNGS